MVTLFYYSSHLSGAGDHLTLCSPLFSEHFENMKINKRDSPLGSQVSFKVTRLLMYSVKCFDFRITRRSFDS